MGATINFGTGFLTMIPAGSNPTPVQVGILKDVSLDISFTLKSLIGNQQFPVDVARGEGKLSGKAKSGQINSALVAAIMAGSTTTTASKLGVFQESGTIPSTPFTITVSNSATFGEDLGVFDVTAGKYLSRVASAPATGQYSLAAGVYTFAAADTGHVVQISYNYTVSTAGTTVAFANQLMGQNTTFKLELFNTYNGVKTGWILPATTFSKLSLAFKNTDYTESDLDFECFADAAGNVLYAYTSN